MVEVKRLIKDIQYKTDLTTEEIAKKLGYTRTYISSLANRGASEELLLEKIIEVYWKDLSTESKLDVLMSEVTQLKQKVFKKKLERRKAYKKNQEMKYTLILLLISTQCFGQIEVKKTPKRVAVGEIKRTGVSFDYSYYEDDSDTIYALTYFNHLYPTLKEYEVLVFRNEDETIKSLYKILMGVFENPKNKEYFVSFKLGGKDVSVSNFRSMGVTQARLKTPEGYTIFSEKDIEKLFGAWK